MVQDHQEDVADFQKEATSGQDPALKSFAQKYLPVLKQHLGMAESLQAK
jgi:putative membrane protein